MSNKLRLTVKSAAAGEMGNRSLLDRTLEAATLDGPTITADGHKMINLIEGVSIHEVQTHVDERSSVVELYDSRWKWHPDPLVFAHCFTVRPGYVKGWGLHKTHEDRYFVLAGEMKLVLFDPRPASSTYGEVCELCPSEYRRCLINIPRFIWHAEQNIGTKDLVRKC